MSPSARAVVPAEGGLTNEETKLILRVALSVCLLSGCLAISGCGGNPKPTATEPQAPGQMAKTDQEKMDYLIQMLHRKGNFKKNAQAARELGRMGAFAEPAIPELQKAIKASSDEKVRADAQAAVEQIEAAMAGAK